MSNNRNPKKSNDDAGILSWILIVVLLNIFPPLGVIFLIAKLVGNDFLGRIIKRILSRVEEGKQSEASRAAQYHPANSSSQSRARQNMQSETPPSAARAAAAPPPLRVKQQAPQTPPSAPQPLERERNREQMEKKKDGQPGLSRISRGRVPLFVFGWVLLALGVVCMIGSMESGAIWSVLQWAAITFGGGGMLVASWKMSKKEQLYQNCVKIVGDKASIDLSALAAAAGVKPKALEKDLDEMVDRGYFGDAAYYDKARNLLIVDPDKAEQRLKQEAEQSPDGKDTYDLLLMELYRTVERIQDPEMREKADQIQGLTRAIFSAVREEPEKQSKITSFMNYYFPTTLKLLDSYSDFEAQGFQGDNLSKTKERIEGAVDNIIAAYQKQLDSLYLTNSLDVDSDIDVLETMLKRDGLSESDFGQPGTPGTL